MLPRGEDFSNALPGGGGPGAAPSRKPPRTGGGGFGAPFPGCAISFCNFRMRPYRISALRARGRFW